MEIRKLINVNQEGTFITIIFVNYDEEVENEYPDCLLCMAREVLDGMIKIPSVLKDIEKGIDEEGNYLAYIFQFIFEERKDTVGRILRKCAATPCLN